MKSWEAVFCGFTFMKPHHICFLRVLPKKLITLKGSEQQNVSVLATALTAGSLYASANYGNICHIFLVNIFLPAVVVVSVGLSLEGRQI